VIYVGYCDELLCGCVLVVGVVVGVVGFGEGVELLFDFCLGTRGSEAEDFIGICVRCVERASSVEEAMVRMV